MVTISAKLLDYGPLKIQIRKAFQVDRTLLGIAATRGDGVRVVMRFAIFQLRPRFSYFVKETARLLPTARR
jgi:hypothetical protein